MPGRTLSGAEGYRYAFQGQEKDPETGKEAFELRLWDGRIGRWLTTDPYGEYHSPYLGMGNNPIINVDVNGGCTTCPDNPEVGYVHQDPDGNSYEWDGSAWHSGMEAGFALNEVFIGGSSGGSGSSGITLGSIARTGADFIPIVGSGLDIYEGIRDGNGWQIAAGVGFLILDLATLGSSSLVKGGIKTTIKTAKNADKLVDIYKGVKNGGKYFGQSVNLVERYTRKIGPELITRVPERLKDAVEQQLISIHGTTKYGNGLGGNKRLQMSLKRQIENKDLMKEAMDFLDTNVPGWMGL